MMELPILQLLEKCKNRLGKAIQPVLFLKEEKRIN